MRKIKLIILSLCFVFLLPTVYAQAVPEEIKIDAYIDVDGNMKVVENISWYVEDDINGIYRDIFILNENNKLSSATGVEIENITVDGQAFEYSNIPLQNGVHGKYSISTLDEGGKKIKIHVPKDGGDEIKTKIEYVLKDVVIEYLDIAEIHWNFIGDTWENGIDNVEIKITLPGEDENVAVFGHGPLNGVAEIIDGKSVELKVDRLRAGEEVTARILFDHNLVLPAKFVEKNKLKSILAEEEELVIEANNKRKAYKIMSNVLIVVSLATFLYLTISLIREKKKKIPVEFKGEYYRELPEDYGPSVMNQLMCPDVIVDTTYPATLLDLVRKKHVEIEPIYKEKDLNKDNKKPIDYKLKLIETNLDKLDEVEKYFIQNIVFYKGNEINMADLTPVKTEEQVKAIEERKKWLDIIKQKAEDCDIFKKEGKYKKASSSKYIFLSFLLLVFATAFGFMEIIEWAGLYYIFGFVYIFISVYMNTHIVLNASLTQKGAEHKAKWEAFKKFLEHFSNLEDYEHESIVIWEHYLVYATALGVADKVIKQLKIEFPEQFNDTNLIATNSIIALSSDNGSFGNFTSSFNTTMSSASGSGGGFSGGGGSGGGGGGGGSF